MSSLRAAAADRHLLTGIRLVVPSTRELTKAVLKIRAGSSSEAHREPIEVVSHRIIDAVRSGAFDTLMRRDIRRIPEVILEEPYSRDPQLRDGVLALVESRTQRSAVSGLIAQYLERFGPDDNVRALGRWLAPMVGRWDWDWSARSERYCLFDATAAPASISTATMASPKPPREFLAKLASQKTHYLVAWGGPRLLAHAYLLLVCVVM